MNEGEPKLAGNRDRLPKAQPKKIERDGAELVSKYLRPEQLDLVERMSGYGTPIRDIGIILGYNPNTFEEWYKRCDAIQHCVMLGVAHAKNAVRNMAHRKCMEGDTKMIQYWLNCRDNWVQKSAIEHSGQLDASMSIAAREISRMSPEESLAFAKDIAEKLKKIDEGPAGATQDE